MNPAADFQTKYELLSGIVHSAKNEFDIAEVVNSVLAESNGQRVALAELPPEVEAAIEAICHKSGVTVLKPPYDNTGLPDSIDEADVGVSWANFAVAETGSLVELATNDATRLVSTLPGVHIGIFRHEDVKTTLREAAEPIREFFASEPKNATVTFISGPSRTADIEMRLTLGVHGPESAHAVIVQDSQGRVDGD